MSLCKKHIPSVWVACVLIALPSFAFAQIHASHASGFRSDLPIEASKSTGVWLINGMFVATGHSDEIDSLGATKGAALEAQFAREDCRRRILERQAVEKNLRYDPNAYRLQGEIPGFQTISTFTSPTTGGLFLTAAAPADKVAVEILFDSKAAEDTALAAFNRADFREASSYFALISKSDELNPQIAQYAKAAKAHVKLLEPDGAKDKVALSTLGEFYYNLKDLEQSIKYYYRLYQVEDNPSDDLIKRLGSLSDLTGRSQSAIEFHQLLNSSGSDSIESKTSAPLLIANEHFTKPYQSVLRQSPIMFSSSGAKVIEWDGKLWFVAVGETKVMGSGATEALRQKRVSEILAQKEAVAFTNGVAVTANDSMRKTTVIRSSFIGDDVSKSGSTHIEINDITRLKVKAGIKGLRTVGTWKSFDGLMAFTAVGFKL